jgi:hypothetical protein
VQALDRRAREIHTNARPLLSAADGRFRVGFDSGGVVSWTEDLPAGATDLRALDADTVIGTWKASALPAALAASLRSYVEPYSGEVVFYFLLKRMKAATGRP